MKNMFNIIFFMFSIFLLFSAIKKRKISYLGSSFDYEKSPLLYIGALVIIVFSAVAFFIWILKDFGFL